METTNPRRWWILIVLCLSSLVLMVDGMALTVAVPRMTQDIGATAPDIQWILDSYVLVFAGLLLTSGSLGDRFGRRRVMLIGLLLFGAASLAATFATTPGEVIGIRIAMGVGGALIMPSTLSILITVFDADERRKAMAAWTSVSMLGLVGSPVFAGLLLAHFSWHSIFFINVPVVALAIAAGLVAHAGVQGALAAARPARRAAVRGRDDRPGVVDHRHPAARLRPRPVGHQPDHRGRGARRVRDLGAHHPAPMVPLGLFRHRNFSGGSMSLALVEIGNGGLLLLLTQYLQFVLGYPPVKAGLAFVPLAVGALTGNTAGVQAGPKLGNRYLVLGGMLVMAASFWLLTTVSASTGFAVPAAALGLLGLGAGLAMPAAVSALMATIPPEQAGVGSALNDTIGQAGSALGVAILGSLLASGFARHMPASAPAQARQSIGGALAIAHGDSALVRAAREAFTSSMSATFAVSAVGVLAAAILAALIMRDAKPASAPATATASATASAAAEEANLAG